MIRTRWEERRLAKQALTGNRDAAEKLVARHYASVSRFLLHLTGDIHEAEELAQDTFVGAWQSLATFEGKSSLRTWLHRIAFRKYVSRRNSPESHALQEEHVDVRQDFVGPLIEALAMEQAIATLPEQLRVTFLICQMQELTAREAAEILGVPEGTVLSRMHTARERLRRQLAMREIVVAIPSREREVRGLEGPQQHEMSKTIP